MVPLKDENPISITPYVTYILIVTNVAVFAYELSLNHQQLEIFWHFFAVVPLELTKSLGGVPIAQPIPELATLVSCQFLHASFAHLGFNMLFLWIFGNNIEEELGGARFLIFYLLCGALAALSQWFFSATSDVPSLGASGAIAGVMGAYILKFPTAKIFTLFPLGFLFPVLRIPAVYFLGFWFIEQALNGIASLEVPASIGLESGGVAYWAHAGGFLFGAVLAPVMGLFHTDTFR